MEVKVTGKRALAAAAVLGALGLALAWSGVVNVGASTGHTALTDWFLHWAMRNSVRTHAALHVEKPAADDSALVAAAGHYAANCAACHGAPGEPPWPVMQASTPPAPDLAATVPTWSDAQLFWIIKHGVKFTAMPAWPALERDDEVRRMTAFVRLLPDMMPRRYRELAYGEACASGLRAATAAPCRAADAPGLTAGEAAALADCERCHADGGRGSPDIPILAGQKPGYLLKALEEFAAGERASGVMRSAAVRADPALWESLAMHYAALPDGVREAPPARGSTSTAAEALAERVVREGLPERNLPACSSCHAPGKRPWYPALTGQNVEYLAGRLRGWRAAAGEVETTLPTEQMPVIARRIPEELIEPLARHFAAR